jgi:C-lobe and N-lobe beta barrels of Tf-binding protein B
MRIIPILLLMTSGLALTACAGGGAGGGAGILAQKAGVCNINEDCDVTPAPTPDPAAADSDGDGIPDSIENDPKSGGNDGNTGSGAGGNTTALNTGARSLAIQKFVLDKPAVGTTSLVTLTSATSPTMAATEAAFLSGNAPKSIKVNVDTKTAKNTQWAVTEEMPEDLNATRDLRWIYLNQTSVNMNIPANYSIVAEDGTPIYYDPTSGFFRYSAAAVTPDGTFGANSKIDMKNDFYWNQIKTYMGSKANAGFKEKYREYRLYSRDETNLRDELLQVWTFNNSYATNYENQIGGGAPKQQAWSFGGNAATNVPTSGTSHYNGRFVGTAKAEGWDMTKYPNTKVNANANWMVQGRSELWADFDTSSFRGTLSPESWTSDQGEAQNTPDGLYTWLTSEAAIAKPGNVTSAPSVGTGVAPNFEEIYGAKIKLSGTISAAPPTVAGGAAPKTVITGGASITGGYLTSANSMQAGLYGTNADELTGVFSVEGLMQSPKGGTTGIVDGKNASLIINGAFNGQCTPGVDCAP